MCSVTREVDEEEGFHSSLILCSFPVVASRVIVCIIQVDGEKVLRLRCLLIQALTEKESWEDAQ